MQSYRDEQTILLSFAREAKYFLHVVSQEAMVTRVFLRHTPKGDDVIACECMSIISSRRHEDITFFDVAGSSPPAGVQRQ